MTTTSYLAKFGINGLYLSRHAPKPIEPVRPVTDCETCNLGCDCEGGVEGIGCKHHGCWGRAATHDCPSSAVLRKHGAAFRQYISDRHDYDQQSHRR